jgi:hypothetical protein
MARNIRTYRFVPSPTLGLNTSLPSNLINEREVAGADDVIFKDGYVQTRFGCSALCSSIDSRVTNIYHYESVSGGKRLELFNLSAGRCWYVSGTSVTSCGLSGITVASANSALLASATGWHADNYSTVAEFKDLSASQPSLFVSHSTYEHQPGSAMSPILYQVAAGSPFQPMLLSSSDYESSANSPVRAKILREFAGHLCLYNTYELGSNHYQRVRWSAQAKFGKGDWPLANYNDLIDSKGGIVNALILNNTMIIYKEDSIIGQTFIGASGTTFRWDVYIPDEGLIAPNAVIPIGNSHIFVGKNNIYRYYGGRNITPIGDRIWEDLRENITNSQADSRRPYINRITMVHYRDESLVGIFYPQSGKEWNRDGYVYNYRDDTWTSWSTLRTNTAFGEFENPLDGSDYFTLPITGDDAGRILKWGYFSNRDDTGQIVPTITTKTFQSANDTQPDFESQWDQVAIDAKCFGGTSAYIYMRYSRNGGSFTAMSTNFNIANSATDQRYKLNKFHQTAHRMQFKFTSIVGVNNNFKIGQYSLRERLGSDNNGG